VGGAGGAGLSNAGTIATLTNSGKIDGGHGRFTAAGGAGVSNSGTIRTLTNSDAINGGNGGGSLGAGGAGVLNFGTIRRLTNSGTISGGSSAASALGGAGGAGMSNVGTVETLTNSRTIRGGAGGSGSNDGGAGGAGVSNGGTIRTLTNSGAISAGNGFSGFSVGGAGGAGLSNAGTIAMLSNAGTISGGSGGSGGNGVGATSGVGGAGGAGIANSGSIAVLINSGKVIGGAGGAGPSPGAAGDAILSAGAHASIGLIANSGRIIGNVEIDNQASATVTGGTGKTFGSWTGGTITIGNGDLIFAGGNTALGDDISVDGGLGTVTNKGPLQIATLAPLTITGNFTQSDTGVLGLDFAGDTLGQYGALSVSKLTTLDGGLAIDLTDGFTLTAGDKFDILAFAGLAGPGFDALALDGSACSSAGTDRWACDGGVRLREVIDATSLDLVVAHGSAALGPGGSSPIPEPSTWAMLALGFLGLGGLGLRKRGRAGAS
jgi:hypothetical protein